MFKMSVCKRLTTAVCAPWSSFVLFDTNTVVHSVAMCQPLCPHPCLCELWPLLLQIQQSWTWNCTLNSVCAENCCICGCFCVFHLCCVICLQSCRGEHFHESGEFLLSFAGFNAWTVSGPVDGWWLFFISHYETVLLSFLVGSAWAHVFNSE